MSKMWPLIGLVVGACVALSLWMLRDGNGAYLPAPPDWDLQDYVWSEPVQVIPEIEKNLSGLTYSPHTQSLFAITNSPAEVHEISLQGTHLRTIDLSGFRDTESITHIAGNQFAIAEEQRYQIHQVTIDASTTQLRAQDAHRITLREEGFLNMGIEGIGWSKTVGFIAAKEFPPKIWLIDQTDAVAWQPMEISNLGVIDLAGLDVIEGPEPLLLLLSEASNRLVLVDMDGNVRSSKTLGTGWRGLEPVMQQPEGVAVDERRFIYIVGEPNEFLVLRPRDAVVHDVHPVTRP